MKEILLAVGLLFLAFVLYPQSPASHKSDSMIFYYCDEIPAKYPGGQKAMNKIFSDNMRYPLQAERQGIGGCVIVQYVIDTFGDITDVKIIEGVREDLNNEALRLIGLLKGWSPGSLHSRKIISYRRQPFIFLPEKIKHVSTKVPSQFFK